MTIPDHLGTSLERLVRYESQLDIPDHLVTAIKSSLERDTTQKSLETITETQQDAVSDQNERCIDRQTLSELARWARSDTGTAQLKSLDLGEFIY